ncbi:DUF2062 domain-containing protein [uncultured Aquincola sp.]|uniref:DUF2062 domain-containing protein n=1 Tax=uncultured Aquincola sp. TaxID=886556 RepID=UPI0032B11105
MRWIPSREDLLQSRWLSPVAHHLQDDRLWHLERGCVARAVAIGLFFGLLLPFAQFFAAALFAVWLRAHLGVAAGATFITNPLTFAPLYWLAHRIGQGVLGDGDDEAAADAVSRHVEAAAAHQGWLSAAWDTVQDAGAPLIVGLAVMAVVAAIVGFLAVWLLWRPRKEPQDYLP